MSPKISPSIPSIQEIHRLSTGAKLAALAKPFACVPQAATLRTSLSDLAFRVYALLIDSTDRRTGLCDYRQTTLAEKLGKSVRSIERAIGELHAAGMITRQRTQTGNRYKPTTTDLWRPQVCESHPTKLADGTRQNCRIPSSYSPDVFSPESGGDDSGCIVSPPSPPPLPTPRPTPTQAAFEFAPLAEAGSRCEPPPVERASTQVEGQSTQVERKPPVRAPATNGQRTGNQRAENGQRTGNEARFQRVRGSLNDLADALHRSPPDDGFVRLILAAAPAATGDEIHSTLVNLWKCNAFSTMRGWGLVLVKFKDCFGAAA